MVKNIKVKSIYKLKVLVLYAKVSKSILLCRYYDI